IAAVLKIPAPLRYQWGVYKNLLCGVTTVVNHGEKTGLKNTPISIFEETHCLHSVQFEKQWKIKLNNPVKKNLPVNIHVGEGTDAKSAREIDQLIKFNLLKRKLVGVHGVAMTTAQAKHFEALVWCPETNFFLLNKTAPVDALSKHTEILFGTDSTLTGSWKIWEHLRFARGTGMLSDEGLFATLNNNPAGVWKLNCGDIVAGKDADLVVAKKTTGQNGYDAFFALNPTDILLVTHKGEIALFDEALLPQLQRIDLTGFSRVFMGDCRKYVKGDLPALIKQIMAHNPQVKFPVTINETPQA
ncbi:MAG: amidohydrolase family protein, partial [Mucilaginibacter sp.]